MKTLSIIVIITIITIVLIYAFQSKNLELSKIEFESEYNQSKILHTVYEYKLVELKDNKIFLSKKEMIPLLRKWKETILSTNFKQLNPIIQEEISKKMTQGKEKW